MARSELSFVGARENKLIEPRIFSFYANFYILGNLGYTPTFIAT